MATTWKSTPKLCKINLFEHFMPLETLVLGVKHTETNVENGQKLPIYHHIITRLPHSKKKWYPSLFSSLKMTTIFMAKHRLFSLKLTNQQWQTQNYSISLFSNCFKSCYGHPIQTSLSQNWWRRVKNYNVLLFIGKHKFVDLLHKCPFIFEF